MTLDAIHTEWAKDSTLDFSRPDAELRNIPLLHAKYWQLYTTERNRYMVVKQEYDTVKRAKTDWYAGRMSDDELKERGWPPQGLRIVRQEIDQYLVADGEMAALSRKFDNQKIKLEFLEDCIKHINNRNFVLRNYIEWLKFSQGAS